MAMKGNDTVLQGNEVFSPLTHRDFIAVMAMQGILSCLDDVSSFRSEGMHQIIAQSAYEMADAMIAESKKKAAVE